MIWPGRPPPADQRGRRKGNMAKQDLWSASIGRLKRHRDMWTGVPPRDPLGYPHLRMLRMRPEHGVNE